MSYPGGKNGSGVYQQIINRIPPHKSYTEPFLGGGAIMRMKRPANYSTGIDIDAEVINSFPKETIPNLMLLQADSLKWLSGCILFPSHFIYCDPPYLFHTRSTPRSIYTHEMTTNDHKHLLIILKQLNCMVMISGYPNIMYDDALSSWTTATFQTTNRGGGLVTEKLWMNYPTPTRLHDYRYLGTDFRARERIKKKQLRWTRRLKSMPDLERYALMASIDALKEEVPHR